MIIANKRDLYAHVEVSEREGIEFAEKNNYKFYSSSAKRDPKGFYNFLEELVKDYSSLRLK